MSDNTDGPTGEEDEEEIRRESAPDDGGAREREQKRCQEWWEEETGRVYCTLSAGHEGSHRRIAPTDTETADPWNGCFSGDCPHETSAECVEGLRSYVAEIEQENLGMRRQFGLGAFKALVFTETETAPTVTMSEDASPEVKDALGRMTRLAIETAEPVAWGVMLWGYDESKPAYIGRPRDMWQIDYVDTLKALAEREAKAYVDEAKPTVVPLYTAPPKVELEDHTDIGQVDMRDTHKVLSKEPETAREVLDELVKLWRIEAQHREDKGLGPSYTNALTQQPAKERSP